MSHNIQKLLAGSFLSPPFEFFDESMQVFFKLIEVKVKFLSTTGS